VPPQVGPFFETARRQVEHAQRRMLRERKRDAPRNAGNVISVRDYHRSSGERRHNEGGMTDEPVPPEKPLA
jgi:hypothetical protein